MVSCQSAQPTLLALSQTFVIASAAFFVLSGSRRLRVCQDPSASRRGGSHSAPRGRRGGGRPRTGRLGRRGVGALPGRWARLPVPTVLGPGLRRAAGRSEARAHSRSSPSGRSSSSVKQTRLQERPGRGRFLPAPPGRPREPLELSVVVPTMNCFLVCHRLVGLAYTNPTGSQSWVVWGACPSGGSLKSRFSRRGIQALRSARRGWRMGVPSPLWWGRGLWRECTPVSPARFGEGTFSFA